MITYPNPFTPSFGTVPLQLAGRQEIVDEIALALEEGAGSPYRANLFIGPRGSGKTALLIKLASEAEAMGWIAVNVTAIEGMLEDIIERTQEAASHIIDREMRSQITSISGAGFGITRTVKEPRVGNWRSQMNRILDELAEHSVGLVIAVDEVNVRCIDELRLLVATFQHFISERREVVLLLAGLPHHIYALTDDDTVSFLRRAMHHNLTPIPYHDVHESLKDTVQLSGRTINNSALDTATNASGGYPFLIQLIGFHMWRQHPGNKRITEQDVQEAIRLAGREMDSRIFDATYRGLSRQERRFVMAMVKDEGPSRIGEIAQRLGISNSNAGQYRRRLIHQGVIGERGWGEIGFDLPMFREYLIKNADVRTPREETSR